MLPYKALQQTGLSLASLPLAPAAERRYVGQTGQTGMGANLVEYQLVRIAKLLRDPEDYKVGSSISAHPRSATSVPLWISCTPKVWPDRYVVECSGPTASRSGSTTST